MATGFCIPKIQGHEGTAPPLSRKISRSQLIVTRALSELGLKQNLFNLNFDMEYTPPRPLGCRVPFLLEAKFIKGLGNCLGVLVVFGLVYVAVLVLRGRDRDHLHGHPHLWQPTSNNYRELRTIQLVARV